MQVYQHGNKYNPPLFRCHNCGCIIEINQLEKIGLAKIENEKSSFTCPECLSLNIISNIRIGFVSNNWCKMNHIPMKRKNRNRVIIFPKIVKADKKILTMKLENVVGGSIIVNQYLDNGELGKAYELGITASDNEFAIKIKKKNTIIILPKDKEAKCFLIKYNYKKILREK